MILLHRCSTLSCFIGSLCLLTFLLTFVGCAEHSSSNHPNTGTPSKFGYGGINPDASFIQADTTTADSTNASPAPATPPAETNTPTNPFLSPTPQPPSVTTHDLPYGTPVPGKPGFVTSPHSPSAGYVDVRGFPPGTEVKDPYSGKVFLVP